MSGAFASQVISSCSGCNADRVLALSEAAACSWALMSPLAGAPRMRGHSRRPPNLERRLMEAPGSKRPVASGIDVVRFISDRLVGGEESVTESSAAAVQ